MSITRKQRQRILKVAKMIRVLVPEVQDIGTKFHPEFEQDYSDDMDQVRQLLRVAATICERYD
jgi:hypothetical protein